MKELITPVAGLQPARGLPAFAGEMLALLEEWRGELVFGMMVLECLPVAGFLVPGQITLAVAGYWAANRPFGDGLWLYIVAIGGVVSADGAMYALGRFGSSRLGFLDRLVGRNASFSRALMRQGRVTLLLYQFPPYSRMFAAILFGAARMELRRFLPLLGLGSLAFVTVFGGIGWTAGVLGRGLANGVWLVSTVSALFAIFFFAWLVVFARQWWVAAAARRGRAEAHDD